jgi:uncharacterized protein HemY
VQLVFVLAQQRDDAMRFLSSLFKLPTMAVGLISRLVSRQQTTPATDDHPEDHLDLLGPTLAEAEVYLDMGQDDLARQVIDAYLLEHPNHTEALRLLARLNKAAEAGRAQNTLPDGLQQASLHVLHGHYPAARGVVNVFLLSHPDNPHGVRLLQRIRELQTEKMAGEVETLLRYGRHERAKEVIQEYQKQYPNDGYAVHLMAKALKGRIG